MTTSDLAGNGTPVNAGIGFAAMNCSSGTAFTPSPCSSEQEWYNITSCVCQTFPLEELTPSGPAGVAFLTVAILSALLDLGVVIVFVQFRNTPIVKAANRELSFLLLFVLMICFTFPLVKIGPAAVWKCVVSAFQGPVTTCVYAIFLVKTHRVLSIFEARLPKVVHRQWILGRSLQVVGVFIITLVQITISATCVGVFTPAIEYTLDPVLMVTYLDCKSVDLNSIINSAYPMLLTVLCLCFAFRARRLPENYGESRHILATMAVSTVVFFICFGVSFLFQGTSRLIVLNIYVSVNPIAQLVLLFLPKVYIILVCPERNTVQELRRMTLAHMQRQSEFSPTEGAVRDGDVRRPNPPEESRLRSLRSLRSKIRGLSAGPDTIQVPAENGSAVRSVNARKKSIRIVENGMPSPKNGLRREALVFPDRRYSRGVSETTEETAKINVSGEKNERGDSRSRTQSKHRLRNSMRRQSSGLFVIQFIDETKEQESTKNADKTPSDRPVMFNLRETDSEGEGDGDMFVVSVLGRTLTLTVEDRNSGVPEILGGVYVGSKTVPCSGGTKANQQTDSQSASSSSTNKLDFTEGQSRKSSDTGNCVTNNQDSIDGTNVVQNPGQDPLDKDENNEGNGLDVQGVLIHRSDRPNEMELNAKVLGKCKESCNEDVSTKTILDTEGVFQDAKLVNHALRHTAPICTSAAEDSVNNNTCSNDSLPPKCIDTDTKHLFDDNTEATVSDNSVCRHVCLDWGETERAMGKSQVQNTDDISECSSSSNHTSCETAADDKRRLLSGNWREQTEGPTSISPLDMSDICVQLNRVQSHQV